MKLKILIAGLAPVLAWTALSSGPLSSQPRGGRAAAPPAPIPNPAMTAPDQTAWNIFIQAVRPPTPAGPVKPGGLPPTTLQTWPSDADTFTKGAKPISNVPRAADGIHQRRPVIPSIAAAHQGSAGPGPQLSAEADDIGPQTPASASQPPIFNPTPPGLANPNGCNPGNPVDPQFYEPACDPGTVEEVRRNPSAYNYIVTNQLNSRAGLAKAYKANMTINFPTDAIEVKTNWIPVSLLATYYPGIPQSQFFVATDMVAGQTTQYALIAMHVISKQVPNWTWATFEHQGNRGRCDFLGCKDLFGATDTDVPPANKADGSNQGTVYPNCAKTPALLVAFRAARVDGVFNNYCLKGSQADFTDNNGLAVRLGNSVTENGFVPQASCMSCHGSANINSKGHPTTTFGFIGANGQVGPINPLFYNSQSGGRPYYENQPGLVRMAISADFVWSIPFCAYESDGKSVNCGQK
jgi:hypothetical protein